MTATSPKPGPASPAADRRRRLRLLAAYLGVYLAIMSGVAFLMRDWHALDWQIFEWLNSSAPKPALLAGIRLVDIPFTKEGAIDRSQLAELLSRLQQDRNNLPKTVVLDLWVSQSDARIREIGAGVQGLVDRGVKVYAVVNPWPNGQIPGDSQPNPDFWGEHHRDVYGLLSGYGHTGFRFYGHTVWYHPFINVPAREGAPAETLTALAVKVAEDSESVEVASSRAARPIIVNMGEDVGEKCPERDEVVYAYRNAAFYRRCATGGSVHESPLQAAPGFKGKILIVGNLQKDTNSSAVPGPEVLAWAISEQLAASGKKHSLALLDGMWIMLGLTGAFSLGSYALFGALSTRFRKYQKYLWAFALAAAAIAAGLLFAGVAAVLQLKHVYPQLSLVLAGIVVSAGLAWKRTRDRITLEALNPVTSEMAAEEYDVFISYSHEQENLEWVIRNVYQPLSRVTRADGKPLRIFFDRDSIYAGTSWYPKLAVAIQNSRFFVPVYSQDYFRKNFCRFEMERAAIRRVGQSDFILPIARVASGIPVEYDHIHFLDVAAKPDFIAEIIKEVLQKTGQGK